VQIVQQVQQQVQLVGPELLFDALKDRRTLPRM
jgi:hypothetical protein